ncbi:hypothetical protein L484_011991 [Morus notabilis]|uniref:Uncharacterized protein n=1 Tax=Morus notabilis TaxID=981085 RepID=W9RPZ2_9ROSA|nr:hypothetical protein L484_011991 [Morus notabilis]
MFGRKKGESESLVWLEEGEEGDDLCKERERRKRTSERKAVRERFPGPVHHRPAGLRSSSGGLLLADLRCAKICVTRGVELA